MDLFTLGENLPKDNVFRLPVDRSIGPKGFLGSAYAKDRDRVLYPMVTNMPQEEVDQFLAAGITGPLQSAAEAATAARIPSVYDEVIEVSSLDQRSPEAAVEELQGLVNTNPYLKQFISPATIEMLRQSDNPTARRVAVRKIENVMMAADLIQQKFEEANKEGFLTNFDFVDVVVSDLPGVSLFNVEDRKDWADRFVQLLDSNEDPAIVQTQLKELLDNAADQGFLTNDNRFYLNDFLSLVLEGTKGREAMFQSLMGVVDTVAGGVTAYDAYKGFKTARDVRAGATAHIMTDAARLAAFSGKDAQVVKELLEDAKRMDDPIAAATNPSNKGFSAETPGAMRAEPLTPEEAAAMRIMETESDAFINALNIRVISGQSINDEAFEAFAATQKEAAIKAAELAGNKRLVDFNLSRDPLENVFADVLYGTTKGRAFTSASAAQKLADQIGGEVIPKLGSDREFIVRKRTNVPRGEYSQGISREQILKDLSLFSTTDVSDLGAGFWAWSKLGSPLSQTTSTLNAILKQGESARAAAIATVDKDIIPVLRAVGRDGQEAVERVLYQLRDGALAYRREALTQSEFADYFFGINGRQVTPDELKLFNLVQHRNDVDWFLTADMHFKREVDRGVEMLRFNDVDWAVQKRAVSSYPAGTLVWDLDQLKYVPIETLAETKSIYKMAEAQDFGGELNDLVATATPRTRALRHTDVMGYNTGGRRIYEPNQNNYIIKQTNEMTLAGGRKIEANPTAIMTAKTEKEANRAVELMNSAIAEVHKIIDPTKFGKKDEYYAAVQGQINNRKLDEAIARVSDWNPDVHSVKTLLEFFSDRGLDLRRSVQKVEDGARIVEDMDSMIGDITFHDVMTAPSVLKRANVRKDEALRGFGNKELRIVPPLQAIQRSYTSSIMKSTESAYAAAAINGLIRAAIEEGVVTSKTLADIRNLPLRKKVEVIQFEGKNSEVVRKLQLEKEAILYRLNKQSFLDAGYMRMKDNLANFIYDKGWSGTAAMMDKFSVEPVAALRGITFDLFLGLFAPDQLWVQGSQVFSIAAMTPGLTGTKAVAAMPATRIALLNGNDEVIRHIGKYMGPALGIDAERYFQIVDTLRSNGRTMVQASLADLGEDSAGKVVLDRFRGAGRVFYNEGELAARISAHIATSLQLIERNPAVDLYSAASKRFVMHESDKLTMAMTSTSRTAIEQLPMAQFTSYMFRVMEYMTSGLFGGKNVLTPKQKIKLGTTHMALFGIASMPFIGPSLDYFNYKYAQEWDQDTYELFRNGMIDGLMEYLTGIETEIGRRIAWGEGVYTLTQNLAEGNIYEALGGPSAGWIVNLSGALSRMAYNIKVGGTDFVIEDTLDVFRTIKSVNLAYNAYYAWKFGTYYTKKGDMVRDDIDPYEAAAIAFGIPLEKVNETWRNIEYLQKDKKNYQNTGKLITGLWNDLSTEYRTNGWNTDRATSIRKAIELTYAIHDPFEREQIERYVNKDVRTLHEQIWFDTLRAQSRRQE